MKWQYVTATAGTRACVINDQGEIVARIVDPCNGPLVAEAPAMLAALRGLLEFTDAIRDRSSGDNVETKAARAVLDRINAELSCRSGSFDEEAAIARVEGGL